ncbi:SDR family NAD(P)-dependent oxidoreductase [Noviherbaspirillum denitrificans]|uniref:Short-chain dehydrogenase n=1 Tax=Noviherbaspirillum denitrificans TaxID=1968433 RepID=A0A254TCI9_9BURK|nr:SDR family oxidoreductase [Noviherbaspirillum denitrificans]OWW19012.1 short-chain dehydrogenase [Noviherbaspirillum denitrificans]
MSKRIAIITGGGTGIGRASAEAFAASGMRVVCLGMDADGDLGEGLEFRKLDVTSEEAVRAALAGLERIDVVVNGAGIILHEGKEFSADGFRKVLDVNLTGAHIVSMVARERLAASKGAIVNVASMWSQFGSPRNPSYSASKAGITALTRSHAVALAEEGIRVNAVAPGWIRTKLSSGALDNPERATAIMARLPMKRWGKPEDVARAVRFLCSDDASYITGVVLPVDGGFGIA